MIVPPSRVVLLVLTVVGLAASAGRPAAGSSPAVSSMRMTPLDRNGLPVLYLTASDFRVWEDGVAREVVRVEPATDPLSVMVLIDTAQFPMGQQPPVRDLRRGLTAFVRTVLAADPESRIALMEIGGAAVRTVNFTGRAEELEQAIGRIYPTQRGSAVLLEGLIEAAREVGNRPFRRRALLSLTFHSPEGSRGVLPARVGAAVRESAASYWAISILPPTDSASATVGLRRADETGPARAVILEYLTMATGGDRLTAVSTTGLETLFTQVADCLDGEYIVSFARPDEAPAARIVQAAAAGAARVLVGPAVN